MAGVAERDARVVEAEVHAVDHRVDARDLHGPRADDRGVVAEPAHDALGAALEQVLEDGDQRQLAARPGVRSRYRWR